MGESYGINGNNEEPKYRENAEGDINKAQEIERIRDIIFGSQQKDIERRLKTIERNLESATEDLRGVKASQSEGFSNMEVTISSLEEKNSQDFDAIEARLQNFRRELLEKITTMERHLQDAINMHRRDLNAQNEILFEEKLDIKDLSKLLVELGMRLAKDASAS